MVTVHDAGDVLQAAANEAYIKCCSEQQAGDVRDAAKVDALSAGVDAAEQAVGTVQQRLLPTAGGAHAMHNNKHGESDSGKAAAGP